MLSCDGCLLRERSEVFELNRLTGAKANLKQILYLIDAIHFLHLFRIHFPTIELFESLRREVGVVTRIKESAPQIPREWDLFRFLPILTWAGEADVAAGKVLQLPINVRP